MWQILHWVESSLIAFQGLTLLDLAPMLLLAIVGVLALGAARGLALGPRVLALVGVPPSGRA